MTVGTIDIDEAKRLVAGAFGKAALETISSFSIPVCWARSEGDETTLTNGTAFVVRTGKRTFLVTASHVVDAFQADQELGTARRAMLAPRNYKTDPVDMVEIDLVARLISRSKAVDIATIELSEAEITALCVSTLSTWPPVLPERGAGVLLAGFPGHQRMLVEGRNLDFAVFPALAVATEVASDRLIFQRDLEHCVQTQGFDIPPANFEVGGMSGGPVLTLIDKGNGLLTWALGGVITDGVPAFDALFASPADCICEDGSIRDVA